MRKTLGAIALVLLLAAGVWVNSRLPSPHAKARGAVGDQQLIIADLTREPIVEFYESGTGPTLVLHPSLGRHASDFNELVNALNNKNYATRTIEPAGISEISEKEEYKTIKQIASPVGRTIARDNVVLIGHAYGNRAVRISAYHITSYDYSNVKAVILLAAGGQIPMEPQAEQSLKNIFNPLRTYRSRIKDIEYAFFAEGNEIPPHWKRGWHTKTAMAQATAVTASAGDDSWHCAGGVPMLIVQPMQDRIAPIENAYALKEKCPQEVEIVEVQNAGHALLPEQPEAVAKAVLDFLAKHHPIPPE